jgi:hypothetical protein
MLPPLAQAVNKAAPSKAIAVDAVVVDAFVFMSVGAQQVQPGSGVAAHCRHLLCSHQANKKHSLYVIFECKNAQP